MELHHDKHHKAYVDGANTTLDKLAAARESGDFASVLGLQQNLSFHLSGHVNHSVFWQNMTPDGEGAPAARWPTRSPRTSGPSTPSRPTSAGQRWRSRAPAGAR